MCVCVYHGRVHLNVHHPPLSASTLSTQVLTTLPKMTALQFYPINTNMNGTPTPIPATFAHGGDAAHLGGATDAALNALTEAMCAELPALLLRLRLNSHSNVSALAVSREHATEAHGIFWVIQLDVTGADCPLCAQPRTYFGSALETPLRADLEVSAEGDVAYTSSKCCTLGVLRLPSRLCLQPTMVNPGVLLGMTPFLSGIFQSLLHSQRNMAAATATLATALAAHSRVATPPLDDPADADTVYRVDVGGGGIFVTDSLQSARYALLVALIELAAATLRPTAAAAFRTRLSKVVDTAMVSAAADDGGIASAVQSLSI